LSKVVNIGVKRRFNVIFLSPWKTLIYIIYIHKKRITSDF